MRMGKLWIGAAAFGLGLGGAAQLWAQSDNRVSAQTDWAVFVEESPKICWAASAPTATENTRDGNRVEVTRGEIMLLVSLFPAEGRGPEISFTGGYPFAENSTVEIKVGENSFSLFTQGEMAWAASASDDQAIITAMKRGAEAVLTARSARGTQTQDTFSLLGFTAAVDDATARCAQ